MHVQKYRRFYESGRTTSKTLVVHNEGDNTHLSTGRSTVSFEGNVLGYNAGFRAVVSDNDKVKESLYITLSEDEIVRAYERLQEFKKERS